MTTGRKGNSSSVKRFYKNVTVQPSKEHYGVMLDGRPAKTRTGAMLAARSMNLAEAVAHEWRSVSEEVDFKAMPMTRLLSSVVDLDAQTRRDWIEEIVNYLKTDLLCYRAEAPDTLRTRQAATWDPYLDWARRELSIDLKTIDGVIFIEQSKTAIAAARMIIDGVEPEILLSLKSMIDLTGSAVLGFALWKGVGSVDEVFAASRLDETFQSERWGPDTQAEKREKNIHSSFMNAVRFMDLLRD